MCACAKLFCARACTRGRAGAGLYNNMEQYNILERVGEGAHGVVLKAKHLKVD